ncbi:MAG: sigma-54-dependent Fis family transcriptional regulator [Acidobacteria bacterium]|nr:sigma-54-dependent Fis family transcriptional regulator [Acidobacteriota bacterium]
MAQGPSVEGAHAPFGLVGDSPEIQRVLRIIRKLRNDRCPILLLGESGTGKELVARALHVTSPAAQGPFVAVNAAALSPTLIESELFGHARGSFTGAAGPRRGLLEQAHGGTLFLDEISEFALEMQAKLLRAVEEKEVRRVGANHPIAVEVRLIAATNRDLAQQVELGRFRADLFYRLNVVSVRLPPLRERRGDIPLLVTHFLALYAPRPMTAGAWLLNCLAGYDWPGNVRELQNAIRRMIALCSGDELQVADLPTQVRNAVEASQGTVARQVARPFEVASLEEVERLAIEHVMKIARGDRRKAAQLLGIGKTTLYRKLREYEQKEKARAAAR